MTNRDDIMKLGENKRTAYVIAWEKKSNNIVRITDVPDSFFIREKLIK